MTLPTRISGGYTQNYFTAADWFSRGTADSLESTIMLPGPLSLLSISSRWRPVSVGGHVPARFRASGALQTAGRPIAGAVLSFHPLDQALFVYPQAVVGSDGRFEVRTPYFGAGAPAGEYAVTISWHDAVPLPYTDPARTPLRAVIQPRLNRFEPWEVRELLPLLGTPGRGPG